MMVAALVFILDFNKIPKMYFLIAGYDHAKKTEKQDIKELQQDLEMQCLEWLSLLLDFAAK
jgi:hypothetical protein